MAESMGFAATMIIIVASVLIGLALGVLLKVIPFWIICKKAGFAGPLAVLMLVPIADIILPFYNAFADWPALRQRDNRPVQ